MKSGWARGEPGMLYQLSYCPVLVEQIVFEPMTDNPMSSAHRKSLRIDKEAVDKKATVELPGVLRVAPPSQATDRICTVIAGFTRTHNLRPAEVPGHGQYDG
jgi:hypothetical protein